MTRFILARHAETEWNSVRRIQGGASNVPLNEKGRQQAETLALRLKDEKLEAVYSSPLVRAFSTAEAIAAHHKLDVISEPDLKEIDAGEYEGVPVAEVGKRLSQILIATGPDGEMPALPGGESLTALQRRAWGAIQRLAEARPEGNVLVVSHYFVILSIISAVLDIPLSNIGRFRLNNGSLTVVEVGQKMNRLLVFNESYYQKDSLLF